MALILGLIFIVVGLGHLFLFVRDKKREHFQFFLEAVTAGLVVIWIIYFW